MWYTKSKAKDRLDPCRGSIPHEQKIIGIEGETGRQTRDLMYNHRVIFHKDSTRSHLEVEKEKIDLGTRRGNKILQKVDCKAMNSEQDQSCDYSGRYCHIQTHDSTRSCRR